MRGKAGLAVQLLGGRGPLLLHHHGHQVAALGDIDSCLHQVGKRQFAKALAQRRPTCDGARNGYSVHAPLGRVGLVRAVFAVEVSRRPGCGGMARGIQAVQLLAVPQNAKRIRTQAVAHRLGNRQGSGSGDGRVDGITALPVHAQARLRGQRVRGADDVARKDRQARRAVGVGKVKLHGSRGQLEGPRHLMPAPGRGIKIAPFQTGHPAAAPLWRAGAGVPP